MSCQRILVLYAGGTIGMEAGGAGYAPGRGLMQQAQAWLAQHPRLRGHDYTFETREPLIDSANAVPADWLGLASTLWQRRQDADGFVVLHGTDTLAYTASALSYLTQGFGKPIVITGAQRPASTPDSDARANLGGAVLAALASRLCEVTVFFGGALMRGNRVRKYSAEALDAFRSPHWPLLGSMQGQELVLDSAALPGGPVQVAAAAPALPGFAGLSVGLVTLYPGISAAMIAAAGKVCPSGLVLSMYGAGAGPAADRSIIEALGALTAQGIPLLGVSQCFDGRIDLRYYEAGRLFADCGVIDGADLSPEAGLTKLYFLASQGTAIADMARALRTPIAGEMST